MTCAHVWDEVGQRLNYRTVPVRCKLCGQTAVAKSKGVDPRILPYVAHELLCFRLGRLLAARGVPVEMPTAALSLPLTRRLTGSAPSALAVGPWYAYAAVIDDVGPHERHPLGYDPGPERGWPVWLYAFDRWIGRRDGAGETNLLFMPDGRVQPVDWEFAFPWTIPSAFGASHCVDNLEVPAHPRVVEVADPRVREVIRGIGDEDLWAAVVECELPAEIISPGLLVAIWAGLRLRRDLL